MSQVHLNQDRDRVYKVMQTASLLRVSVRTIWRLVKEQRLKVIRIGRSVRIDAASVEEFIAKGGEQ